MGRVRLKNVEVSPLELLERYNTVRYAHGSDSTTRNEYLRRLTSSPVWVDDVKKGYMPFLFDVLTLAHEFNIPRAEVKVALNKALHYYYHTKGMTKIYKELFFAVLYILAVNRGIPITIKDIMAKLSIFPVDFSMRKFTKYVNELVMEGVIKLKTNQWERAWRCVLHSIKEPPISDMVKHDSGKVLGRVRDVFVAMRYEFGHRSWKPRTIAGAVIYIALKSLGIKVTQSMIKEVLDVDPASLRIVLRDAKKSKLLSRYTGTLRKR